MFKIKRETMQFLLLVWTCKKTPIIDIMRREINNLPFQLFFFFSRGRKRKENHNALKTFSVQDNKILRGEITSIFEMEEMLILSLF